jgi:putative polyhydroxyalkanoate system protein
MAEIKMQRRHDCRDLDDVRSRIEGLADRVSQRIGGTWSWEGNEAVCESRGAEARVGFDEENVSIEISLPLMLRPLRVKIEAKIEEYYGRYFESE